MASTSRKHGGRSCVAGGPGGVSCTNTQYTQGISMHVFPSEEKYPKRRQQWVKFVRKHRPHFVPSKTSVLCSAHFEETSYTKNLGISTAIGLKRKLVDDAIPSIDTSGSLDEASTSTTLTPRDRRKILRRISTQDSPTEKVETPVEANMDIGTDTIIEKVSSDDDNIQTENCDNCTILKLKIVKLQKRISWLTKSKQVLVEKLQTSSKTDTEEEGVVTNTADVFSSDEDIVTSQSSETTVQENWSSLEEESVSSALGDDEEQSKDSTTKVG